MFLLWDCNHGKVSLTVATIAASKEAVIWSGYGCYRSNPKCCSRFYWKCILSISVCWIIVFSAIFLKNKTHLASTFQHWSDSFHYFPSSLFFYFPGYRNPTVNCFPATKAASLTLWGLKRCSARKQGWLRWSVSAITFTCIRNYTCRKGAAKSFTPSERM